MRQKGFNLMREREREREREIFYFLFNNCTEFSSSA